MGHFPGTGVEGQWTVQSFLSFNQRVDQESLKLNAKGNRVSVEPWNLGGNPEASLPQCMPSQGFEKFLCNTKLTINIMIVSPNSAWPHLFGHKRPKVLLHVSGTPAEPTDQFV